MNHLPLMIVQPAEDLRAAVRDGIYINLDNYFEVAEVERILLDTAAGRWKCVVKNRYCPTLVHSLATRVRKLCFAYLL